MMSRLYMCRKCSNTTLIPQDRCLHCNSEDWKQLTEQEMIYGVKKPNKGKVRDEEARTAR